MYLYHLTNPNHLISSIEEDGYLDVTESNIGAPEVLKPSTDTERNVLADMSPYGEHYGPDVVWLTKDPTRQQFWQIPDGDTQRLDTMPYRYRKDLVLFTVELDSYDTDLHKWSEWAFEQGINPAWYDSLNDKENSADDWFVYTRRILRAKWVSIHNLEQGTVYWHREFGHAVTDAQKNAYPLPATWKPAQLLKVVSHHD